MADTAGAAGWQPFDHNNPPDGACWLEVERPETWCDAGDDGCSIGGYTGKTYRLVVLAEVYASEHCVQFERIPQADCGEVNDDDVVRRFMPLAPPELPA